MKIKNIIYIIIIAAFAIAAYHFLPSVSSTGTSNINVNSSFVSISYPECTSCSGNVTSLIYSLLTKSGYSIPESNVDFNTSTGNNIISDYLVADLPSAVIPATNSSSNILSALVYLNIFNSYSNHFVLNTPFLAGLTRNVTYLNLLQNGTVSTAYDVYNASALFNVSDSAIRNYTNPSEFLFTYNSEPITIQKKTGVVFIYSNSIFSAAQDLVLYTALKNFGNFSTQVIDNSSSVPITTSETVGGIQYYGLDSMQYNSSGFSLEAFNLTNAVSNKVAENLLFEYDQNSAQATFGQLGNFMPLLDIGGKYLEVSSLLNPLLFNNMSIGEIANKLDSNPVFRDMFEQSVYFVEAALCSSTIVSYTVCSTPQVENAYRIMEKQI